MKKVENNRDKIRKFRKYLLRKKKINFSFIILVTI